MPAPGALLELELSQSFQEVERKERENEYIYIKEEAPLLPVQISRVPEATESGHGKGRRKALAI